MSDNIQRYTGTDGAAEHAAYKASMRAQEAMQEARQAMEDQKAAEAQAARQRAEIEAAAERAYQRSLAMGSDYIEVRTDGRQITAVNTRGSYDSRADGITMVPPQEILRDLVVKAHGVEVSFEQAKYMLTDDQLAAAADEAFARRGLPFRFR